MTSLAAAKSLRSATRTWGGSSYIAVMKLSGSSGLSSPTSTGSSSSSGSPKKSRSESSSSSGNNDDIASRVKDPPGFVFKQVDGPLGPGASKESQYKNPEYFKYHAFSYTDLDVVMAKYRCPQPNARPGK